MIMGGRLEMIILLVALFILGFSVLERVESPKQAFGASHSFMYVFNEAHTINCVLVGFYYTAFGFFIW